MKRLGLTILLCSALLSMAAGVLADEISIKDGNLVIRYEYGDGNWVGTWAISPKELHDMLSSMQKNLYVGELAELSDDGKRLVWRKFKSSDIKDEVNGYKKIYACRYGYVSERWFPIEAIYYYPTTEHRHETEKSKFDKDKIQKAYKRMEKNHATSTRNN